MVTGIIAAPLVAGLVALMIVAIRVARPAQPQSTDVDVGESGSVWLPTVTVHEREAKLRTEGPASVGRAEVLC